MSLLRDIQDAATASDIDVSVLLRKCLVLAARLGNNEFKAWVESELNGYKPEEQLPPYRLIRVHSRGDFLDPFGGGFRNVPIPMTALPPEYQKQYTYSRAVQPISYYEDLLKHADKGASLQEPWAPEFVAMVGQDIVEDKTCVSARKIIAPGKVASLVDAVRNRVLGFVLSIEAEDPEAGDAPLNSNPVPQEKVTQIFHTYISGNVQNVATGGNQVTQTANIAYNEAALAELLRTNGVPQSDIDDLMTAIEEDKTASKSSMEVGPKVTVWMAGMLNKAVKGTWKVGVNVAAAVVARAIAAYYGLP